MEAYIQRIDSYIHMYVLQRMYVKRLKEGCDMSLHGNLKDHLETEEENLMIRQGRGKRVLK